MLIHRTALTLAAAGIVVATLAGCSSSDESPSPAMSGPESAMMEESPTPSDTMMEESPSPSDAMMEESPSDAMMEESPSS